MCPICDRPAQFKDLVVDQYVKDILANTSRSVEQVTIEPSGEWSTELKTNNSNQGVPSLSDDDDDLIEITDRGGQTSSGIKSEGSPNGVKGRNGVSNGIQNGTPIPTRTAAMPKSTPNKRGASAVIDLTLSDDDDAPPPPKMVKASQSTASPRPAFGGFDGPSDDSQGAIPQELTDEQFLNSYFPTSTSPPF